VAPITTTVSDDIGPLLSADQTVWLLVALGWFALGVGALAVGRTLFGVAWLLLGVGGVYRVGNPG